MSGHEMFTATNRRSGRTYRVDSMSFPAGHFTSADTPHNTTRWTFQVVPAERCAFSDAARSEWDAALAVSGTKGQQ